MANYYGSGRSNYVTVTDKEKWKELCNKFSVDFLENSNGKVGFTCTSEDGDLPSTIEDPEESQDDIEVEPLEEFCKLLADEEVLVFQTVGNEKLRYLNGYAIAYNNKGEYVTVNLSDIYEEAQHLGKNITTCEY